jgi:hypothetical protein
VTTVNFATLLCCSHKEYCNTLPVLGDGWDRCCAWGDMVTHVVAEQFKLYSSLSIYIIMSAVSTLNDNFKAGISLCPCYCSINLFLLKPGMSIHVSSKGVSYYGTLGKNGMTTTVSSKCFVWSQTTINENGFEFQKGGHTLRGVIFDDSGNEKMVYIPTKKLLTSGKPKHA